jgi:hypothetical protein
MKTAAHYRAMAEECIKWAGEAYTAEVRESYLQLARIWLDTASRLNGLSTGEAAPEHKKRPPHSETASQVGGLLDVPLPPKSPQQDPSSGTLKS